MRVYINFIDGGRTYGEIDFSGAKPSFIIGGDEYDLESFAATGATCIVNDAETLKKLQAAGVNVRPSGKQTNISISVTPGFKERIAGAAKSTGRTTTSIMVEATKQWLAEHGY